MKSLAALAPRKSPSSSRPLQLSRYLASVPPSPLKVYWEYKVPADQWNMFGNDSIGDCTCACIAHTLMCATIHTGSMVVPTVEEVVAAYSAITGYVPGDPSTDQGAAIPDVLEYWRKTGIAGHQILAWAEVDQTNIEEVRQAIWLFGGVNVGISVYQSMEEQFDQGKAWDQPSGQNLGGHSVPLFGYGRDGCTCVTWAKLQQMGWGTFSKICSEAYAVVTQDWVDKLSGKSYSGFDISQLLADLADLKQD